MSQIQVRDTDGVPLPFINIRLALGDRSSDEAYDDRFTDLAGNTAWPNPIAAPSYTLYVNDRNVNTHFGSVTRAVHTLDADIVIVLPDVALPVVALQRITAHDRDFWLADGTRHQICGSTELMLAHLFDTQGIAAVLPILEERRDVGFTNLRVLWQKDVRNANQPWVMPVDKLGPFLAACGDRGFYVQGTILADCQVVNPDERLQQLRVSDVRLVTTTFSNLIEQLGNEFSKNGFDPRHFSKPADRLAVNASNVEGGAYAPFWDFMCFSGQRSPLNHAMREYGPLEFIYGAVANGVQIPAICDEGMIPGENSSNPRDFERAGAQARSGNGGRFHSRAGSNRDEHLARLFTPLEKECALAFVKGLKG